MYCTVRAERGNMHTDAFSTEDGIKVVVGDKFAPSTSLNIMEAELLELKLKAAIQSYQYEHDVSRFENEGGLYV